MKYLLPIVAIIFIFISAGCATTTKVETQRVEVPIAIPCKTETPTPPTYCFNTLTQSDDIFTKTKCLLSDRLLSLGYEIELSTALRSCK